MILESSLILQIIPPEHPGVSILQSREDPPIQTYRGRPGLPTARLQDLATCDTSLTRRSHAGMVQQTLRFKPSGKKRLQDGPQKLFRKYGPAVFLFGL